MTGRENGMSKTFVPFCPTCGRQPACDPAMRKTGFRCYGQMMDYEAKNRRKRPRNRKRRTLAQTLGSYLMAFCTPIAVGVALIVCAYVLGMVIGATHTGARMGFEAGDYMISHAPHKFAPMR